MKQFGVVQIVPPFDCGKGVMIRHVALQRRNRDVTLFNGIVVSAIGCVGVEVLFADPKIRLSARIDVFADHWPRILYSLPGNFNALNLTSRKVDVEERTFGQSFGQHFLYCSYGKLCRFAEIKIFAGDQAEGESRYAQNGSLERPGDGAGVSGIIAQVAAMINSGSADVRQLVRREYFV
jgi:hypothetical protein